MRGAEGLRTLDVGVAIDVDDADLLGGDGGDAADAGEADGVVAPDDERHRARRRHVRHRVRDLVERLLDVGRDREHVAHVGQRHLLA